jgi:predicted glutamine amidotransferase
MCRLFAQVSLAPESGLPPWAETRTSLLFQSHADIRRRQGDGWGIGWFDSKGRPRVAKSPGPMYRERAAVRRAGARAKSSTVIGHVRWASNPLKLDRRSLIGLTHTQPFTHGKWMFAHNGTLYIPREVSAKLGRWKRFIRGKNDSEVLFYWILKHWNSKNPAGSIRQSLRGLEAIWKSCRQSYPLYRDPYHGLNFVLSDGWTTTAFCCACPRGFGRERALTRRTQPYYQLQMKQEKDSVVIASEPLDAAAWTPFRHGELVTIRRGRVLILRREIVRM